MRIASVQLNSQNDLAYNLTIITQAVQHAKNLGADLVVLPENACYMGRQWDIMDQFDTLQAFFAKLCTQYAIHMIAGTLPCPYDQLGNRVAQKCYQTSLAFDDTGKMVARYDKIHLFCATVNDGVGNYDESLTFLAGNKPSMATFYINHRPIHIGMMICFDLRFAKLAHYYRQLGADILVAPSAFTYTTGQVYWQLLLQARAIDSQCLTVGAAQGGIHQTQNSQRQTWGHSSISDCTGNILATSQQTHVSDIGFDVVIADFDYQAQQQTRQHLPIFNCHRLA